jgi:hypothetical protein
MSNFINIRPVGVELFHEDGRRDRHDEANSRFSQYFHSVFGKSNAGHALCEVLNERLSVISIHRVQFR